MTVSSQDTVFQHVGNGVTTVFAYGCQVPTATDLEVYLDDVLQNSGYTIAGLGAPTGGTVTFAVAPANLAQIRIERVIELERTTDYQQNGDFLSRVVNPDFDRIWMALQGHLSTLKRALVVPKSDTVAPNPLPPSAQRANNLLGFDANGQPVAVIPSDQSAAALQLLLATNAGASLIGFDSTTLDQVFKNSTWKTVNTLAAFKAVDKNKYTRVSRLGTGALGDGGRSEYWLDTSDLASAGDDWNIVVANDGARWKRLRLVWQTTTTATDPPTFQFARNTTHTGGTPGFVCNALNVSATVNASTVTNYEWAFLAQMDNSAAAGENVAVYAQAIKRARGPTWAGCFEIQDKNGDDPAQGGTLGIELAVSANGADTSFQRIGLHVAMGKNNPGGTTCEWGTGVYTGAGADSRYARAFYNDGPVRLAAFFNAADSSNGALAGNATFLDTGKSTYGIDLSAATYTGVAMRLAAGQGIAFDTGGTPARIRKAGSNLAFENSPALFSGGRAVFNNGFGLPSSGNVAASATAGSSGATPAQVAGYLIFQLDGSNFKIPYYGP